MLCVNVDIDFNYLFSPREFSNSAAMWWLSLISPKSPPKHSSFLTFNSYKETFFKKTLFKIIILRNAQIFTKALEIKKSSFFFTKALEITYILRLKVLWN